MNNRRYTFIGLTFLVVITVITTLLLSGAGSLLLTGRISGYSASEILFFRKFIAAKDLLKTDYYKDITEKEIFDGAMSGMLDSLNDPYTEYLSADKNKLYEEITESQYEGVGIYVSMDEENRIINIEGVLRNTPAEAAELKANDKIVSINGVKSSDGNLTDAVNMMKCAEGTKIKLLIDRNGELLEKEIVTGAIIIETVYSEIKDDIGYILISTFSEHTGKEFADVYNSLREKNIKGLIIDVRGNGGGIYDEAVKIAQIIVPEGTIVYTENKDGVREAEVSTGKGIDIPLVVLIDGESASASEILAGAIKDRKCGTLVGEKTFGKGLVQAWYSIGDGTSIKMTVSKYFTPNGICIDGIGINPDIEVRANGQRDLQLEKALDLLKK